MTVSRSRGPTPVPVPPEVEPAESVAVASILGGWSGSDTPMALCPVVQDEERIVSARRGRAPFLVRRSWADVAPTAERRARCSAPMGTSRFMTPELDCRVYDVSSKMASWLGLVASYGGYICETYDWQLCPDLGPLIWDDGESY